MPSKACRSYKASGMNKTIGDTGGVDSQGYSGHNTTYPCPEVDSSFAEGAPYNPKYAQQIPSTPTTLGTPDLGSVVHEQK